MLRGVRDHIAATELFLGMRLLRFQLLLLAIALTVTGIIWLLQGRFDLASSLIYTLVAGNVVAVLMSIAAPLYVEQPFPRDWIVYLSLLLPVAFFASTVAALALSLYLRIPSHDRSPWLAANVPFGGLVSFASGVSIYIFASVRSRLEAANTRLAEEVHTGRRQIESHASELRAAFEIQSSLLPKVIPQIPGVEISCAWQPAKTVSGDFFDVLILSDGRIAFCLADVSGKGISAALLTANLQATFRAFVLADPAPATLCKRLNQALCANLPPSRFVTLVYGIIDRRLMTMTYEVAGHTPPTLLRGSSRISLHGSGPVLGLLPNATYTDQSLPLQTGDRLILSTDGVTEAFNTQGEEFGEDRLITVAARRDLTTAHAIRSAILGEVTRFSNGDFHDDASLMIIVVTG